MHWLFRDVLFICIDEQAFVIFIIANVQFEYSEKIYSACVKIQLHPEY